MKIYTLLWKRTVVFNLSFHVCMYNMYVCDLAYR